MEGDFPRLFRTFLYTNDDSKRILNAKLIKGQRCFIL